MLFHITIHELAMFPFHIQTKVNTNKNKFDCLKVQTNGLENIIQTRGNLQSLCTNIDNWGGMQGIGIRISIVSHASEVFHRVHVKRGAGELQEVSWNGRRAAGGPNLRYKRSVREEKVRWQ